MREHERETLSSSTELSTFSKELRTAHHAPSFRSALQLSRFRALRAAEQSEKRENVAQGRVLKLRGSSIRCEDEQNRAALVHKKSRE